MGFCRPGETGLPERLNAQPASLYQHCGERLDLRSHLTHHNPPGETRSVLGAPVIVSVNEPRAAASFLGIITMVQAPGHFAAHKNLTFSQYHRPIGLNPRFLSISPYQGPGPIPGNLAFLTIKALICWLRPMRLVL